MSAAPMATAVRLRRVGRALATGSIAAAAGGLIAAAPARIFMRLVALATGAPTEFSWSGSIGIAVIFGIVMLPGALVAGATTGRSRVIAPAAGAALLFVMATGMAGGELGGSRGRSVLTWIELGGAVLGVYASIAALPLVTLRIVNRLSRTARQTIRPQS